MPVTIPTRKILVLAANPQDTSGLRLDEEVRGIQRSIQLSKERDRFQIVSEWAVRTEDLIQTLMTHQPHIVHFVGHGSGQQGLILDDGRGRSQRVPTRALARLFQQVTSVECVLLNACYSDTQAQAICQFVSCVIGMNRPVGDPAAICFARGFYTALGHGSGYEAAYEMGRTAIDLEGLPDVETPVLRLRSGKVVNEPRATSATSDRLRGELTPQRIFISYRDQSPDKDLAQQFYNAFVKAGHDAFMAKESIKLGEDWRDRISSELRECDYFLLLLSPLSATSEMVTEEVKRARSLTDQREDSKPTILPIRVNFPLDDPLNYELRGYLQQIQQREWQSKADTPSLLQEILTLIQGNEASLGNSRDIGTVQDGTPLLSLAAVEGAAIEGVVIESVDRPPLPVAEPELKREPGGSVLLKSGLYVERSPIEADCFTEIEQPGALIRIKAPRQMGKTSLMARILHHAREQGYETVPISFQRADSYLFNDLDLLLKCWTVRSFC